ncbi:hypothetical protein [Pseudoalteromonas luteoviolacea]|uniref:Uncharacterized protein n=1 Tax=Pseudoalteromonas luteoviolacea S4060-1 TaxID=1365257 RepID=A0A162C3G1_9GAMM|nr:hypothetical protein [Pseudoalteromonas luteoviolacea]KZN61534.1 hypothetical protein N478_05525 [Pseudoalteromonas luteoviolacea S4060-1]
MSEALVYIGLMIRVLEVFVVVFLLLQFKKHKWSLFFGGKSSLKTIDDHELHSCFIAALCVVVFHNVGNTLAAQVLASGMEKLELRRIYYFILMLNSFACSIAIYFLHSLRHCSFSKTAKRCLYLAIITASLCFMQLIARGIFDYNAFSPFYKIALLGCNITTLVVVALHPVKAYKKLKHNAKEA